MENGKLHSLGKKEEQDKGMGVTVDWTERLVPLLVPAD